jgi:hypothetical protein
MVLMMISGFMWTMMRVNSAEDYLRSLSDYTLDCVAHATNVAQLLLQAGRAPWIGRIRETRETERGTFHAPLTPIRFRQFTWTTHYVCCAGEEVFDPIAGEPLPVESYAQTVLGRPLPVERFLTEEQTAELLARGELRKACR